MPGPRLSRWSGCASAVKMVRGHYSPPRRPADAAESPNWAADDGVVPVTAVGVALDCDSLLLALREPGKQSVALVNAGYAQRRHDATRSRQSRPSDDLGRGVQAAGRVPG